jgi:hypothetical protein
MNCAFEEKSTRFAGLEMLKGAPAKEAARNQMSKRILRHRQAISHPPRPVRHPSLSQQSVNSSTRHHASRFGCPPQVFPRRPQLGTRTLRLVVTPTHRSILIQAGAYATLLFAAPSDSSGSCGKTITTDPRGDATCAKYHSLIACFHSYRKRCFQVFAVFRFV